MRIIKIIYNSGLDTISTTSVRHIRNLSIRKAYEHAGQAYIDIYWGAGSTAIQLPTEKAYELYNKIVSCLSDEITNLEVELINGENGDTIDYKVVEK